MELLAPLLFLIACFGSATGGNLDHNGLRVARLSDQHNLKEEAIFDDRPNKTKRAAKDAAECQPPLEEWSEGKDFCWRGHFGVDYQQWGGTVTQSSASPVSQRYGPQRAYDATRYSYSCSAAHTAPIDVIYQQCTFGDLVSDKTYRWIAYTYPHTTYSFAAFSIQMPDHVDIGTPWLLAEGYIAWQATALHGRTRDEAVVCYQEEPPVTYTDGPCSRIKRECYHPFFIGKFFRIESMRPTSATFLSACQIDLYTRRGGTPKGEGAVCTMVEQWYKCCNTRSANSAVFEETSNDRCEKFLNCDTSRSPSKCYRAHSLECDPGMLCDKSTTLCRYKRCKLLPGVFCKTEDRKDWCDWPTDCTTVGERMCKVPVRGWAFLNRVKDHCAAGLYRDVAERCTKPPLAVCSNNSECMTGAMCVENACKCDEDKTTVVSNVCVPKSRRMYATCSTNSDCHSFSECVTPYLGAPNKQCICHVIFDPMFNDLECSIRSNMRCGATGCTSRDLACENDYCKYKRGQACPALSANLCQSGTTCINGRCVVDYNQACDNDDECSENLKCDATNKKCYLYKNEACSSIRPLCTPQGYSCDINAPSPSCKVLKGLSCSGRENDCQHNSVCSDTSICVMSAGSSCANDNECEANTICDGSICKLILYQDCQASNRRELCKTNTECDTVIYQCKIKPNKACTGTYDCVSNYECQNGACFIKAKGNCGSIYPTTDCASGYSCDATAICTVKLKDSCAGSKTDHCTFGTKCDPDQQNTCRVMQGRVCVVGSGANVNADCFNKLLCDEGICVGSSNTPCDPNVQNCKSGLVCDIQTSRCSSPRGGRCRDIDRCAKGYECNDGRCKLPQNAECHKKAQFCPIGTSCSKVDRSCKLLVGGNCENLGGWCPNNTRCDVGDNKCKLKEGNPCKGDTGCLYDLRCDDHICKLMTGGDCSHNASLCGRGLTCDTERNRCYNEPGSSCDSTQICANNYTCDQTLKCKLNVGGSCSGNKSTHCPGGSTCDRNGNICKLTIGTRCANRHNLCVAGLICDEEEKCKLNVNVDCKVQQGNCAKNYYCDHESGFVCKLSPGKVCINSTDCGFEFQCSGAPKTCIRTPNGPCIVGDQCPIKYDCVGGKCKLQLDESCAGSLIDHCGGVGVCESQSHTCKVQYGKISQNEATCRRGSSWNANTKICTVGYDDPCAKEVPGGGCTGVTVCDTIEEKCLIPPAGPCNSTRNKCASGLSCDLTRNKCMLRPGDACTIRVQKSGETQVEEDDCPEHAQCDKRDNKCRFKTNANCSANTAMCMVGMECDILGGKKCRLAANADCTLSNECFDGYVCDVQKLCRIGIGSQCSKTLDLCATGSECGRDSQCMCSEFAPANNGVCTPNQGLIFGQCKDSDDSPCDDPHAACVNGTCACNETTGMVGDMKQMDCKLGLDQPCLKFQRLCASGSVCSNTGQCQVPLGEVCQFKGKTLPCDQGGVCENGTCQSGLYGPCGGDSGFNCSHQLLCDPIAKVCKRAPGQECSNMTNIERPDCTTGARCSDTGICTCIAINFTLNVSECIPAFGRVESTCRVSEPKCDEGMYCNSEQKCKCRDDKKLANVEENRCQLMVGEKCKQHDDCAPGMDCDTGGTFPYCKFVINQPCKISDNCVRGTRCDEFDNVCKLEQGIDCNHHPTGCLTGMVCSRVHQICKKQREAACEKDDDCIEASSCVESICKCNEAVAVPAAGFCDPAPTRAGGMCKDGKCYDDLNLECVKGVCNCRTGSSHGAYDFSCVGLSASSNEESGFWTTPVIVGVSLGLIGVVGILLIVGITRRGSGGAPPERAATAGTHARPSQVKRKVTKGTADQQEGNEGDMA